MVDDKLRAARRRVVVTGLGVLSPAGGSLEELWQTCVSGRSALRRIENMDVSPYPVTVGGEVDNSLFTDEELPGKLARVDRAVLLGKTASGRALRDAGVLLTRSRLVCRRRCDTIKATDGARTVALPLMGRRSQTQAVPRMRCARSSQNTAARPCHCARRWRARGANRRAPPAPSHGSPQYRGRAAAASYSEWS